MAAPSRAEALTALEWAQAWAVAFAEAYPGVVAQAQVGRSLMLTAVVRDRVLRRGARWL